MTVGSNSYKHDLHGFCSECKELKLCVFSRIAYRLLLLLFLFLSLFGIVLVCFLIERLCLFVWYLIYIEGVCFFVCFCFIFDLFLFHFLLNKCYDMQNFMVQGLSLTGMYWLMVGKNTVSGRARSTLYAPPLPRNLLLWSQYVP